MRTIKLAIEYDGTDFSGWQSQRSKFRTVQAELEKAVKAITGESVPVIGAARTDAGVHAWGQCAHVRLKSPIPASALLKALNAKLPADVSVLEVHEAPRSFHARASAISKVYEYRILNRPVASPLSRRTAWHIPKALDIRAMQKAARRLLEKRDFKNFSSQGSYDRNTHCHLKSLVVQRQGAFVSLRFEADRFLYKMVRHLTGHLVQIGLHRPKIVPEPAPPHGLFLKRVLY